MLYCHSFFAFFLAGVAGVSVAESAGIIDPFSDQSSDNLPVPSAIEWNFRNELHGYYQSDVIRNDGLFDVGSIAFDESYQQIALDSGWQVSSEGQWSSVGRFALIQNTTETDDHVTSTTNTRLLLEGYLQWGSESGSWGGQLGRIKPQWSNGYNWTPANLLKPSYDQVSLDDDNLTQQRGWDMGVLEWRTGQWNVSSYAALYDRDDDNHLVSEASDPNRQYAVSINREGDVDTRLVVHHLEEESTNYAFGMSTLLNDAVSVRIEGAWQEQRELSLASNLNYIGDDQSGFGRYVLGSQLSLDNGWDVTIEYLYNEHGYSDSEWQAVEEEVSVAKANLQTQLASDAYTFLADSYDQLAVGPLRKQYLYVSLANTRSSYWMHYRQSFQMNLDDDSVYHNLELIQNWSEHVSTRLKSQIFTGCESCEYGLLPSEQQIRFSLYYHF